MAVPATEFEVEYSMDLEARVARLEATTEHIQRDVTEIKGDLRRIEAKLDATKDSLIDRIESLSKSINERFESLSKSVNERFEAASKSVNERFSSMEMRLSSLELRISSLEVKMIRWFVGTAIALASLAFGFAKYVN